MGSFMTELWESIFTPGPTPTLLIAANASFAALQIVLFVLLVATSSAHFIALSVICAGVWWGINWFAVELRKAQATEEEAARIRKSRSEKADRKGGAETSGAEGGSEGEEEEERVLGEETEGTETETEVDSSHARRLPALGQVQIRGGPQKILGVMESARLARQGDSATSSGLEPKAAQPDSMMEKRVSDVGSSADLSSVSTDSEWEKVSEGGS